MAEASKTIRWIWLALAIWAIVVAAGASLFAPSPNLGVGSPGVDWRRGGIVLLIVGGFVGLWVLLLAKQPPRGFRNGSAVTGHRREGIETGEHDQQQNER